MKQSRRREGPGGYPAQGLDNSDSLFNGLVGLRQGAAYLLYSRNPQKGSSLSVAFTRPA